MNKIDIKEAIKLRKSGLSYRAIGEIYKCSGQAVWEALKRYNYKMGMSNFHRKLPTRVANYLIRNGLVSYEDVKENVDNVDKIKHIGPKYKEIIKKVLKGEL